MFLPADWYLAAFLLHTVLTKILRFAQADGGRREEIEAAPVMGWPLDSCHSERSEESRCVARMTSLEFMQGPGTSPLPADWYLVAFLLHTVLTKILRFVEPLQRASKSAEAGPRRTMVSFIGMLTLVHPFATTWHFPSGAL